MSLTYTWKLKSLKKTDTTLLKDVIIQTYWELKGTDEDGYSGTFSGATPFTPTDIDGDGFITYKDLTEEIVLGWIKTQVVDGYKDHIDGVIMKQIDEQRNVVQEVKEEELPWNVGLETKPAPPEPSEDVVDPIIPDPESQGT